MFGGRLELARRYLALLAGPGIERGLIGPREAPRLWDRHVLNSAVLGEWVPEDARVVDVGSGAGLPGIPLALARPDLRIDLIEPLERRAVFLAECVAELGLSGCRVIRGRAEDVVEQVGGSDVVTARAVAPLGILARWCAPLVRIEGQFLVLKGASAALEIERDRVLLAQVGLVDLAVVRAGAGVVETPTILVRARRVTTSPAARSGRRTGRARG